MNNKRPLKDQLSEEEIRKKIVLEFKQGMDIEQIAEQSCYHVKSVQRIVRNFSRRKSYKRRKGAGRPQKLTQTQKTQITNKIRSQPWLSCRDLANQIGGSISPETIRRYLKSLDYAFKFPTKKPKLTKKNQEDRLKWALKHKKFDFSNVVFADEASFWLNGHVQKMWIKKGEEYLAETLAHPAKVHVWGHITGDGYLTRETFHTNLTAKVLVSIMKSCLTRGMNRSYGKGGWILAYDKDPKHTAEDTVKYLRQANVRFLLIYLPER